MSEYISRDAAKQILSRLLVKDAAECACNLVDCVLPADVEPVRRGRWEEYVEHDEDWGDRRWDKCSLCGAQYSFGRVALYCPNCGAKMDSEVENDG